LSKIGDFIKKLRQQEGMNITELAEKAEISRPYLSQIESGKRNPSNDLLLQLSKALGVSYSVMLEKAGDKERSNAILEAEIEYDELVHRIESLQISDSLSGFIKALREAFDYSIYNVAEMTDLPISEIKALESNDPILVDEVLSKEVLYKLSKCYDKQLLNVYMALLKRADLVEFPGYNHIDMLRDMTGTIDFHAKVEELLINQEWSRVSLEQLRQEQETDTFHIDKVLSTDNILYFNKVLLTENETYLLRDFIELLLKYRKNENN